MNKSPASLPRRLPQLHQLAQLHGVQTSFTNMHGTQQPASDDTLRAVLEALGVPASSDRQIVQSLRETELARLRRTVEPVFVAWDGKPITVQIRIPARAAKRNVRVLMQFEDGHLQDLTPSGGWTSSGTLRVDGVSYTTICCRLPALPLGYHEVNVELRSGFFQSLVIASPVRAYSDPGLRRAWGVFLPMYAAHSGTSWGAGNFTDWQRLSEWAGSMGASVSATLPLLATFLDAPACRPSPYSPASRLFWNEFFVDVTRVPEFASSAHAQAIVNSPSFRREVVALRATPRVDYAREWRLRRRVLEVLATEFFDASPSRREAFERFARESPELDDYAQFRATCEQTGTSWRQWPRPMRDGQLKEGNYSERIKNFHRYIQWLAKEQMADVSGCCREMGMKLYLDLPLGVDGDSYDIWRRRENFALDASAGAPPDLFFSKGQNWGFAPLHPERIREQHYRYLLDYLRFQMRRAGVLRIDHVMGLHRLYWIPRERSAMEGAYVRYHSDELYGILSLESHRHRTVLIGENLGTVPPEVNREMKRHGLRTMFIVPFEQKSGSTAALRPPVRRSIAALNTHDMPPFAAHWRGLDIVDHATLGLISRTEMREKRAQRHELNLALAAFLKTQRLLKGAVSADAMVEALLMWLAKGPAELVLVNLEDLLGEIRSQNTPGTNTERPNWQNKARRRIEQIFADKRISTLLRRIHRARAGT